MSRCFPYPPPGYEKSAGLIESIKLQKEREKGKKDRKKEKKREKKERSKGDDRKNEKELHNKRKRHYEEFSQSNNKSEDKLKTREDEFSQLERSSLTEEQGPAVVQSLCDSPDSTQNSSKRKKLDSAEVSHSTHGVGLRIRLPLLRHKDRTPDSIEQPCFSGRIEAVPPQRETRATERPQLPSPTEQPCFSGRIDATPSEEVANVSCGKHALAETGGVHSCGCSCDSDMRRRYRKLIWNRNPPPLQIGIWESDDQDWLFGKTARRHHGQGETEGQVAAKDSDLGSALCSWPPRACHLPEVGIHALPYVVPF